MTEIDIIVFVLACLWGVILGLFYFGGLWWTLSSLPKKAKPKIWLGLSYAVRMSVALLGFWIVLGRGLAPFIVTIVMFFLVRFIITRRLCMAGGDGDHAD